MKEREFMAAVRATYPAATPLDHTQVAQVVRLLAGGKSRSEVGAWAAEHVRQLRARRTVHHDHLADALEQIVGRIARGETATAFEGLVDVAVRARQGRTNAERGSHEP